ncbi:hypothetical protein MBM_03474 [Drepanopeziza brunnea f. sp. 'multigermtubi' MB_m1]|uniref:BTB domain-containing protein n=1 Tax=Marssonina brunnea f. sp. multigermtubi (strain MB_m1) TaxID=1072389 RepID=K1WZQ7_MARBU|nr:uncharacterized protein MBM_03474 [Drepanopeziza brunnea f. sp. 'multigermtubi' MB_m1]EKD18481.1 hypothetical protein MBM_03474 [Drepanopeziza brunnea f. sp. 'multigermtubi' MB_m1]
MWNTTPTTPTKPSRLASIAMMKNTYMDSAGIPMKLIIVVGADKVEFSVNKEQLCAQSALFYCEVARNEQSVVLEKEDPVLFTIFLNWLVIGEVKTRPELVAVPARTLNDLKAHYHAQWKQLCQCFALGEVLQAPNFRNDAIDQLLIKANECLSIQSAFPIHTDQDLHDLYQASQPHSCLKRLIVDLAVLNLGLPAFDNLDLANPVLAEFFKDAMKESCAQMRERCLGVQACDRDVWAVQPWDRDVCTYHDHSHEQANFVCKRAGMIDRLVVTSLY